MSRGYSRISQRAASRRYTRVPPLGDAVRDFCHSIRIAEPAPVAIAPIKEAESLRCFWNVHEQVERHGGKIVFGWAIFEFSGAYFEAQHHAVWRSPEENLVDITPPAYPDLTETMFAEDPSADVDVEDVMPMVLPHKRQGQPSAEVRHYMSFHQKIERARSMLTHFEREAGNATLASLRKQEMAAKMAMLIALANALDDDDPCFCASGKTFEACCSSEFA